MKRALFAVALVAACGGKKGNDVGAGSGSAKETGVAGVAVAEAREIAGSGSGSGSAAPDAAGLDAPAVMTVDEAGARTLGLFERMADATEGAGAGSGVDCALIAKRLLALRPELDALVKDGKRFDADPQRKQQFDQKYGDQLREIVEPAQPAYAQCQGNPDIASFFAAME